MNQFSLSEQVERDLEDIWIYLSKQSDLLADQKIAQIIRSLSNAISIS